MAGFVKAAIAKIINKTEKGFYTIVGPGSIRSNSKYNVAVAIHKADEVCEIIITLKGPAYEDSKTINVDPMTTQNVEFDVPTIYEGDYQLIAKGTKGLKFKQEEQLNFLEYQSIICIQTDKATYKPGDLVQFRALFMDENTRPVTMEKQITVSINDGEKNRLKQWKDIELKNGVYVGKYQLSEQPVLGQWTIDISEEGRILESKCFEVDKYVSPKFGVTIETAKNVAVCDGIINVTVRSKYTYGKAVKGKATVSIKLKNTYSGGLDGAKALAEKTIEIDGKGDVQFKIGDDFKTEHFSNELLEVLAVMEEALTGNKQEAIANVFLHEQRFRFEGIDLPRNFKVGKSTKFQVAVKRLDDTPVLDSKNAVKLLLQKNRGYFPCGLIPIESPANREKAEEILPLELSANLDDRGIATFKYTFAKECGSSFSIKCKYLECDAHIGSIVKLFETEEDKQREDDIFEGLQLNVLTMPPKLKNPVELQIKSNDIIPYFVYTLVARGQLLKVEYVKVAEHSKEHVIKIQPTFEMIPKVSVFVHFVDGKELRFEETILDFEREFENLLEVTVPAEAQLGENIKLEVNSKPDSYVGLLGVDQSVLLLRAGNDLDRDEIFNKLQQVDCTSYSGYYRYPGSKSGLAFMTNANFDRLRDLPICLMSAPAGIGEGMPRRLIKRSHNDQDTEDTTAEPVIQIRKDFPESWIFEDIESLTDGIIEIQKTVPDTITSWVITGFSLNKEIGLGLTKSPSIIKTFRQFFICTNLPYSLKRGEQLSVPVLVFNYMDQDLEADVTLDNADEEFEFVEAGDNPTKRVKHLQVAANNGGCVNFTICAKNIGQIMLKITAVSPLAGDAVHKKLKVEPEGVSIYKNRDYYLHAEEGVLNTQTFTTKIEIPKDCVPESEFIEVSLMGNILSSTLTNIDKLVRMPYGCGEQNMINFVPNILVLWYLESLGELNTTTEEKAKRFLEIGYQRELTYKHDDGSYSAFGNSDTSGSTWLTAYVMRSFHQAKKYIDIDPQILKGGLNFLSKTQAPNGCFPEVGHVLDNAHMNEFGLTAFVLLAFLENTEAVEKYKETIDRGFDYLQQKVKDVEDLYPLAIALYAFQKRKLEIVHELLARLEALAIVDGGLKWWSKGTRTDEDWCASSNDVEITAYVMMALLEMGNSVLPITKWLITQRNSNGGFVSTQDTVVGLWALIKFAEQSGATNPDMSIDVTASNTSKNFHVRKDNAVVMQSWELPKDTREISLSGKGTGSCIIQISYRYNIMEKAPKPSFKLSTKVKPKTISTRMSMDVFTEFVPSNVEDGNVSNMVVMEVSLPSGYLALPETFDKIKQVKNVKRVESKDGDTNIVIYFDNLKGSEVKCIPIEAELSHAVTGQRPVPIVIYDYYDSQKRATEFYQIEDSLTDNVE